MNATEPERRLTWVAACVLIVSGLVGPAGADTPLLRFVSAPDLLNADVGYQAGRAFDMDETDPNYAAKRQILLDARARAGLPEIPYFDSDYDHLNDANQDGILSIQEGYRGGLQAIYESIAAENPAFLTVSGDIVDGSWGMDTSQTLPDRITSAQSQADIYYGAYNSHLADVGIPKMYGVIGDHELGDDGWPGAKIPMVPTYFDNYDRHLNMPSTIARGGYVDAPARYQNDGRVYAVKENNTLLIGVETFDIDYDGAGNVTAIHQQSPELAGTPDVNGVWKRTIMPQDQIDWLETTLATAQADSSIDSVIVLGHLPVNDRSVRVASSSNMRIEAGKDSPFWQTLRDGGADLYIAGEVHAQSGFMSEGVAQLVGGGNFFSTNDTEYTVVEVYAERIELTLKGVSPIYNGDRDQQHKADGPLGEDKSQTREWRVAVGDTFDVLGTMTLDISGPQAKIASATGKMGKHFYNYDLPTSDRAAFDIGESNRAAVQNDYAKLTGDFDGTSIQIDVSTNATRLLSEESGLRGYSEDGVDLLDLLSDGMELKPWDVPGNGGGAYPNQGYIDFVVTGLEAGDYAFTGRFHNTKSAGASAIVQLDADGGGLAEMGRVRYSGGEHPALVNSIVFEFAADGVNDVILRLTNDSTDTRVMINSMAFFRLYAGDFDRDQDLSLADINLLLSNLGDPAFDLNNDGVTDQGDIDTWLGLAGSTYGDLDLNGEVTFVEAATAVANIGMTGAGWEYGDTDGSGVIETIDAQLAVANIGWTAPAGLAAPVPEPSAAVLLVLGVASLWRRRFRG